MHTSRKKNKFYEPEKLCVGISLGISESVLVGTLLGDNVVSPGGTLVEVSDDVLVGT